MGKEAKVRSWRKTTSPSSHPKEPSVALWERQIYDLSGAGHNRDLGLGYTMEPSLPGSEGILGESWKEINDQY